MSAFDWQSFLQQWSQAILQSMTEEQLSQLPPDVIESQWLGYSGATEQQLAQVEAQLRMPLPPSYREFLKVTNGWRQTTPFIQKLWSTEGIAHFASRHLKWIEAFTETHESAHLSFDQAEELDDLWEPLSIPDDVYFTYGEDQDCSQIRMEYLKTAIEISDVGQSAIYLLNPQVINEEGEWEAWFFADWLPGADRYRSFQNMMAAEYKNFLEMRDAALEQTPEQQGETQSSEQPELSPDRETEDKLEPPIAFSAAELDLVGEMEPEVWRSLKRLTFEFQIREQGEKQEYRTVINAGSSQSSYAWSGLKLSHLQSWLRQELPPEPTKGEVMTQAEPEASAETASHLSNPALTVPHPTPEKPLPIPDVVLEIDQLEIWQNNHPPVHIRVGSTGQKHARLPMSGSLISQIPFSVEVAFKLVSQSPLDPVSPSVTYKAQLYAQNRTTGQWTTLGATQSGALRNDRQSYTAHLNGRSLDPGLYRLHVFTTLYGSVTALTSVELPLVNVV